MIAKFAIPFTPVEVVANIRFYPEIFVRVI